MSKIIGIDLGTTNSCAAIVEQQGQVKLIPYKGGEFIIPSIFAIDEKGNELIGHEAKRQWQLNPRNTLVVVEHDEETIRRADHVLDLGPQAGVRGGDDR